MKKLFSKVWRYVFLSCIIFAGCKTDLDSKQWAVDNIKDQYYAVEVFPAFLDLTYVENHAVANGLLLNIDRHIRLPLIYTLNGLVCLMLLVMAWRWRKEGLFTLLPFALILAGALGNILDRINNGFVVDFLHLHHDPLFNIPVFNVADMLVMGGTILLMIVSFRRPREVQTD